MSFENLLTPKGWNKIIKRLNWFDIGLAKLASMAFGLFLASYFTDFVIQYRWWLLVATIILGLIPMLKSLK